MKALYPRTTDAHEPHEDATLHLLSDVPITADPRVAGELVTALLEECERQWDRAEKGPQVRVIALVVARTALSLRVRVFGATPAERARNERQATLVWRGMAHHALDKVRGRTVAGARVTPQRQP